MAELERHQQKLLDAYMADALPMKVLKERQCSVSAEITDAKRLIASTQTHSDSLFERLEQITDLLTHADRLYASCGTEAREILNSAVFEGFYLDTELTDGVLGPVVADAPLTPVLAAVLGEEAHTSPDTASAAGHEKTPAAINHGEGSNLTHLAGQLTQRWNPTLWDQVSQIVIRGVPEVSEAPVSRARKRLVRRHLTREQADDIIASYLGGKTVYALAVKYKVDDKTIIKRLIDAGVEIRAAKHGIPDSELETIVGLRAAGWTLNQIGDHYERSGTAIRKYLLRHDALEAHTAR